MKKFKVLLLTATILLAVGGAFASKKDPACAGQPQYYRFGFSYFPAGQYGSDYICLTSLGYCTYYQPNPFDPNYYVPCRYGLYIGF